MLNGQTQNPPQRHRLTPAEIEMQARHAAERTEMMARHHNERYDLDDKHARELATAAVAPDPEPGK